MSSKLAIATDEGEAHKAGGGPPATPTLLKRKDFLGIDTEAAQHPNRTYFFKADIDEVIDTCTKKLQQNPLHCQALLVRGSSHYKKAAYELSIADLDRCLALEPDNLEALYYRGMALSKTGEQDKAIADYSHVLALNPGHVNAGASLSPCTPSPSSSPSLS